LLHKAKDIFFLQEQLHYYSTDNDKSVMNELIKKSSSDAKIIQNRTKTLHVIDHISNYIGKNNIDKKYSKEFNIYLARVILIFCLTDLNFLKVKDKIRIVCTITGINRKDLNGYYKNFIYHNKIIQNLIKFIGLKNTLVLHGLFKKIYLKFTILNIDIAPQQIQTKR